MRQMVPWIRRGVRSPWGWWMLVALVAATFVLAGNRRTVTPAYRGATLAWLHGTDLYSQLAPDVDGAGFLYLPHAAILYVPLALLPEILAEIVWRFASLAVFSLGTWRLARLAGGARQRWAFGVMTVFAVPLAFSCARNGQMTLMMIGTMMLACQQLAERRYWPATWWLAFSVALKPLSIVLVLLIAALEAPMRLRLLIAACVLVLVPFFAQRPGYVCAQYAACYRMFVHANETSDIALRGQPVGPHANLFTMLEVWGYAVDDQLRVPIRLLAALATLGICHLAAQRYDRRGAVAVTFSLAVCFLLVMNPRAENNTYSALGPVLGLWFADWTGRSESRCAARLLPVLAICVLARYEVGQRIAPDVTAVWMAPLAGAVFALLLTATVLRRRDMADANVSIAPETTNSHLPRAAAHAKPQTSLPARRPASSTKLT